MSEQKLGVGISTVSAISHASYGYLSGINQRSPLSTLLLYVLPKTSSSEALAFATEARTSTAAAFAQYLLEATVSATLAVDVLQNDMVIAAPATAATTTSTADSSNAAGGSGSSSSSTPPGTSSKGGTLTRGFRIAGLSMTPRYRDRSEGVSLGSDMVVLTVNLALEANAVYEIWSEKLTPVQLLAGLLSFASVLGAMRLATSFLTKGAVIGKRVGSIRVAVSNRIRSRNSSRKSPAPASVTEAASTVSHQSESPRPLLLSPSSVDASSPSPKLFAVVDGGRQQDKEVSSRGSLSAVTAASPSAKALGLGGNIANASRRVMMAPSGPQSRTSLAPLPLSPGEPSLPALSSSSLAPQAVMVNPLHHHHNNSLHLNSNGSSNGNGRGSVDAAADNDEGNGEDKW
jgi:hypothetical protein